jgi:hypothetical protein
MAPKVVAPPRPGAVTAAKRGPSTSRYALGGGAIVLLVVVAVVLAVTLSSGSSPGKTPTPNLGFRAQIVTSLADSKKIAVTFAKVGDKCKSIQCVGNAAGNALGSEGIAANLVHQTTFPAIATNDADGYVQDLIALQQDYKSIAEVSSRSDDAKYVAALATDLESAEVAARQTESALG